MDIEGANGHTDAILARAVEMGFKNLAFFYKKK